MCDSLFGSKIPARQYDIGAITRKLKRSDLSEGQRSALQFHRKRLRHEIALDAAVADGVSRTSGDPVAQRIRTSTQPVVRQQAAAALRAPAGSPSREQALSALRQTLGVAVNGAIVPTMREWFPDDPTLTSSLQDAVETHAGRTLFAPKNSGNS